MYVGTISVSIPLWAAVTDRTKNVEEAIPVALNEENHLDESIDNIGLPAHTKFQT